MMSKHAMLNQKRQQCLAEATKAAQHHRGMRKARKAAIQQTAQLLRYEIKTRADAKGRAKRQARARQDATPDLFQGAMH